MPSAQETETRPGKQISKIGINFAKFDSGQVRNCIPSWQIEEPEPGRKWVLSHSENDSTSDDKTFAVEIYKDQKIVRVSVQNATGILLTELADTERFKCQQIGSAVTFRSKSGYLEIRDNGTFFGKGVRMKYKPHT